MKQKKLKIGLLAAGCIAVIALPVYAIILSGWIHPCPGQQPLTCNPSPHPCCDSKFGCLPGSPPCPPVDCWCEGNFNDPNNWTRGVPRDIDLADIDHSNAAVTDEGYLLMQFSDHTVHSMWIRTDDTGGDDELDIRFENKNPGGDTMTVSYELKLDATNGKVTLRAEDEATMATQ